MLKKLLVFCGLSVCSMNIFAQNLYSWTDKNGKTHYGDKKPVNIEVRVISSNINTYSPTAQPAAAESSSLGAETQPRVDFYATQWCGYCKRARQYFKENKIPYREFDIEKDRAANARHASLGGRGVPLMVVNDKVMNGFSAEGFARFYEAAR